jgi:hypothetical protein
VAASTPPPAPAPESTRRLGLIGTAAALLIVLGVGGYFGYRMLGGGGEAKKTAVAAEAPKSEAPLPTVPSEPAKDAAAPPAAGRRRRPHRRKESPKSSATATLPAALAVPAAAGEAGQEPGAARKAAKAPPKAAGAETAVAGSDSPSKAGGAKAPTAKTAAVAAAAAPQPDRWQQYADAIAGCASEKFFARFMCEQKTRGRFCEGYWGKVPQCPQAGPPQDRGQ